MIHRFRVSIVPQLHVLMHNLKPVLRHTMLAALRTEQVDRSCEIELALVDDALIKKLNRVHRNTDKVTDVLSFPLQRQTPGQQLTVDPSDVNPLSGRLLLGDIVLCLPQAQRQAKEYGHSLERELCFLTAHSVLHLLGYDHETPEDTALMQERERLVMQALDILR